MCVRRLTILTVVFGAFHQALNTLATVLSAPCDIPTGAPTGYVVAADWAEAVPSRKQLRTCVNIGHN